jgi:transposase
MPQTVIGCDLSRAFIDICELPSGRTGQIANTPETITTWLDTLDHDVRLV